MNGTSEGIGPTPAFLSDTQWSLVNEVVAHLEARGGETIAVAESTTGGLVSAALLAIPGASRYFTGGGVLYTLNSRIELAGVSAADYENYRGTTPELLESLGHAMRDRLGAVWCVAESGIAGPGLTRLGTMPGRTTIGVVGPIHRVEVFETGLDDRAANMVEFTTLTLRLLRDVLAEAPE